MFSQTFTPTCQYFYTDISVISVTFRNSDPGHNHNVLLCLIIYHCLCIVFVIALSLSLSLHCLCHCLCYCHHLCRHHCHRHLQKYLLYQSKLLMCLIMTSVVVAKNQSDSVWIDPDCVVFVFSSFEL